MALACQEDRAYAGKQPERLAGFCKKEYGEKVAASCLFSFLEN
jgi:hypothetical protein